jgi:hypothetical protein
MGMNVSFLGMNVFQNIVTTTIHRLYELIKQLYLSLVQRNIL